MGAVYALAGAEEPDFYCAFARSVDYLELLEREALDFFGNSEFLVGRDEAVRCA